MTAPQKTYNSRFPRNEQEVELYFISFFEKLFQRDKQMIIHPLMRPLWHIPFRTNSTVQRRLGMVSHFGLQMPDLRESIRGLKAGEKG